MSKLFTPKITIKYLRRIFIYCRYRMLHKIQTADNTFVTLDVKQLKSELCLAIKKWPSLLTFTFDETKKLNDIMQTIETGNYICKDYGMIKKWSQTFKISISSFRGSTNFQIRERLTGNYTGFGKLWISLPSYKIKEFKMHLATCIQEFAALSKDNNPM